MKGDTLVKITAIVGLVCIEIVALLKNIDGAMLGAVVGAIAGIAGYAFAKKTSEESK